MILGMSHFSQPETNSELLEGEESLQNYDSKINETIFQRSDANTNNIEDSSFGELSTEPVITNNMEITNQSNGFNLLWLIMYFLFLLINCLFVCLFVTTSDNEWLKTVFATNNIEATSKMQYDQERSPSILRHRNTIRVSASDRSTDATPPFYCPGSSSQQPQASSTQSNPEIADYYATLLPSSTVKNDDCSNRTSANYTTTTTTSSTSSNSNNKNNIRSIHGNLLNEFKHQRSRSLSDFESMSKGFSDSENEEGSGDQQQSTLTDSSPYTEHSNSNNSSNFNRTDEAAMMDTTITTITTTTLDENNNNNNDSDGGSDGGCGGGGATSKEKVDESFSVFACFKEELLASYRPEEDLVEKRVAVYNFIQVPIYLEKVMNGNQLTTIATIATGCYR